MTWSVSSCFITLVVLFLWRVDEITEACTCMTVHPQRAFCNADVVIRAKVVGVKAVSGNTNYDIQQIEYSVEGQLYPTPFSLHHILMSPLSAGRLNTDGTVRVIMCDFIQPWGALSNTQMRSLTLRYQSGCDCTIIRCTSLPCPISTSHECLWMDIGQSGPWDNNIACIKGGDGPPTVNSIDLT
uniref:Metalloproteinase inhibitor 2 n=1 Tax=Oncorhynchus tshawytscha TaxID=74940 RepID=A0A8C8LQ62_ONCTS